MANMKLIEAKTLGSTTASVTFSDIPNTYTDLKFVYSIRGTESTPGAYLQLGNGSISTSGYSFKFLEGSGASLNTNNVAYGLSTTAIYLNQIDGTGFTTDTFSSGKAYIPNYTSSNFKSVSVDNVIENNNTTSYLSVCAGLWSNTGAITIAKITPTSGSFAAGSTFYLYGISNVTEGSKATGGIVSYDSTYYYHMFPYSSTFTPTTSLTADYLVVAGGGAGGQGGGGAGGYRTSIGGTALSLTAQAYTVTVGAGGAAGTEGSNSVFSTITSNGGGKGGGSTGTTGGSGGGGGNDPSYTAGTGNEGGFTPVEGYNGGTGSASSGGGGGGASATGSNGTTNAGGKGGDGVQLTAFATATGTGADGGYYAGGGGGAGNLTPSLGGLGGGGNGGFGNTAPTRSASANTGGGGSAGWNVGGIQTGGSGIVIIRYAI
jgi:hypothetical protein